MSLLLIPTFQEPGRLWWLVLVPVLFLLYLGLSSRLRRGKRQRSRLDMVLPKDAAWKRHTAVTLAILSLVSVILAYAKPQDYVLVPRDRATVVVAIDVSRSMMATDVKPSRMEAAKEAATEFLNQLPTRFNVALVSFAGTASLVVPPTTDRGVVARAVENLELAPATAIGDGIYASLDSLALLPPDPEHPDDPAPAAIVLLSDGSTNIGRPSLKAAKQAKSMEVPIFTIAYGTADGYVIDGGRRQPVPVNHGELTGIARASGGEKFSAASAGELGSVYKSIAKSIGNEKIYDEVTGRYAGFALLLAVLAALAVISLGARWP